MQTVLKTATAAVVVLSSLALLAVESVFGALMLLVLLGALQDAQAHDIWTDAREYNKPAGFACCVGNPATGDCEGLTEDQVWDRPNGDVEIDSSRYKARIVIPFGRIITDLPRYTGGVNRGAALDPLVQYAAHY